MKKVFVVVDVAVYEYEECGVGTQVFSTHEKAKEAFISLVEQIKEYIDGYGWICEGDGDSFRAYEDGDYTKNHAFVQIREQVIE